VAPGGEFNLAGDSDVVTLVHESPYLISVPPWRQGDILVDLDMLILRRPACRRYIETNRSMANAPLLLQDWFPETATSTGETLVSEGLPPSEFDCPPPSGKALMEALDRWVLDTWGSDLTKLPGRDELLKCARKQMSPKVTQDHVRALRRKYAPDTIKKGGAGLHKN
jgi:hypothetical protein